MICYALQLAHIPLGMLEHGSRMEELYLRPECQISDWRVLAMRQGKDASIDNILTGGNGFPATRFADREFELVFDLGCQQELADLRALTEMRSY